MKFVKKVNFEEQPLDLSMKGKLSEKEIKTVSEKSDKENTSNIKQKGVMKKQVKRLQVNRNLCVKVNALDLLKTGKKRAEVCKILKLAESTLRGWKKDEDKIRAQHRILNESRAAATTAAAATAAAAAIMGTAAPVVPASTIHLLQQSPQSTMMYNLLPLLPVTVTMQEKLLKLMEENFEAIRHFQQQQFGAPMKTFMSTNQPPSHS